MKLLFDYSSLLESQCKYALQSYSGNNKADSSRIIFERICNHLAKDFLPPIGREDVAAISYSLYHIAVNAEKCTLKEKEIDLQLKSISDVTVALLKKKKTCGELIRRLIDINLNNKSVNDSCKDLNSAIEDFLKNVNTAYFKNL